MTVVCRNVSFIIIHEQLGTQTGCMQIESDFHKLKDSISFLSFFLSQNTKIISMSSLSFWRHFNWTFSVGLIETKASKGIFRINYFSFFSQHFIVKISLILIFWRGNTGALIFVIQAFVIVMAADILSSITVSYSLA